MLTRILILAAVTLAGCAKCADLRETNPTLSPAPFNQVAGICFVDHAAMAAAIATGKLDPSKVTSAHVCLKSQTTIPAGTPCPKE